MIAVNFHQAIKNYVKNSSKNIAKNKRDFIKNLDFSPVVNLFKAFDNPIPEHKVQQMMCKFKDRAGRIDSQIIPKLKGYSVKKDDVWKSDDTGLISEILKVKDFRKGWIVAKFSLKINNKKHTIDRINIHLTGIVQKIDNSFVELNQFIPCNGSGPFDINENSNFISALKANDGKPQFVEKGGVAHEVFQNYTTLPNAIFTFQYFIENLTTNRIQIYLGLDVNNDFTSVIYSNINDLDRVSDTCNINLTRTDIIGYDEGQSCCPPL